MKNIFNPRKKGSPWDSPKAVPPKPRGLTSWGKSYDSPYTKIRNKEFNIANNKRY